MEDRAGGVESKAEPVRGTLNLRSLLVIVLCVGALFWAVQHAREGLKPTTRWAKLLRGGDVDDRRIAARQLVELGQEYLEVSVPSLVEAMGDGDPRVRAEVALCLGSAGLTAMRAKEDQAVAKPLAQLLIRALDDAAPEVRGSAASALGEFAALPRDVEFPADPASLASKLAGLLADPSSLVRSYAESTLVKIVDRAPIGPPTALVEGLNSWPLKESRDSAAVALGAFRAGFGPAVPALVRALDDKEPEVRSSAALALRRHSTDAGQAVPSLVKNLADPFVPPPPPEPPPIVISVSGPGGGPGGGREPTDPAAQAARAIGWIVRAQGDQGAKPSPEVLDALTRTLHVDRQALRDAAEVAIRRIGPGALSLVPALIIDLTDSLPNDDPRNGSTAAALLGDLAPGTERAGAAFAGLFASLDSKDPKIRIAVVKALGRFGPAGSSALPRLRELAEEKGADPVLVAEVKAAADRIEGKVPPDSARRKGQGRRGRGAPAAR